MRPNTERPIPVEQRSSTLIGSDPAKLRRSLADVLEGRYKSSACPYLWYGHAAERIAAALVASHRRER
jgi:UDP-N-acetylglucosamine 2-epimerase (non-hydrolysing)